VTRPSPPQAGLATVVPRPGVDRLFIVALAVLAARERPAPRAQQADIELRIDAVLHGAQAQHRACPSALQRNDRLTFRRISHRAGIDAEGADRAEDAVADVVTDGLAMGE
jgi:hypothetical protein